MESRGTQSSGLDIVNLSDCCPSEDISQLDGISAHNHYFAVDKKQMVCRGFQGVATLQLDLHELCLGSLVQVREGVDALIVLTSEKSVTKVKMLHLDQTPQQWQRLRSTR
jgi:hypothetical protein